MAQADQQVSVAGLSQQVAVTAFRGNAAWTGYEMISGHWYTGPDQVDDWLSHRDRQGRSATPSR